MFYFAQDKKLWAGENPASVGSFDHQSRERYLQPEELPRFFLALRKALADLRDFVNLCCLDRCSKIGCALDAMGAA